MNDDMRRGVGIGMEQDDDDDDDDEEEESYAEEDDIDYRPPAAALSSHRPPQSNNSQQAIYAYQFNFPGLNNMSSNFNMKITQQQIVQPHPLQQQVFQQQTSVIQQAMVPREANNQWQGSDESD